ncbi:MAG: FtsX-like permease family protein [Streptosporangiaceae bacterium]
MRRAPAIVRRLTPHRLALTAAVVTATLSAALLAALASFSATVTSNAVRTSLAGNPATGISVTAAMTSPAAAAQADSRVRAALGRALPTVPLTIFDSVSTDYLDIPAALAGANAQTHVISLQDQPAHALLLAGAWPARAAGGGRTAVAAPSSLAASLHLRPGATILLRVATSSAPVPVKITGIFRPIGANSPYWSLDPVTSPQQTGGFRIYPALVTSQAQLAAGRIPVASATWSAEPEIPRVNAGNVPAFASQLAAGLTALTGSLQLRDVAVTTGLPGLLSGLQVALVVTRSQLAIGVLIFLVIAGATVALATALLSRQRAAEAELLRARGASRWQLAGTGVTEAALIVVPVAALGPVLGGLALPWLARRGPLAHSALRLPVAFPAVAWLTAAAAAVGCGLIIAQSWLQAAGSPVREGARRGRQRVIAPATRSGVDVALVALAVLASWQLARYSGSVSPGRGGSIGVDPVLVSAPVLALAAGAVVMLRLLPVVVRLGDRAAVRGRNLTAAVAAWQISRRPLRQAGPVLLAVLAVATSVLAIAEWSSWQRSAQDRASFSTGADARINLPPAAAIPLGEVTGLTSAPWVTGSTPVIRDPIGLANGGTATLLALDARQAVSVAAIRPDLVGGSVPALLARLVPHREPASSLVPGRPARLLITAELTAAGASQAALLLRLRDTFGISYSVLGGVIPADGRSHQLTAVIAQRNRAAYPLRITGYALQYLLPTRRGHAATLTIRSVRGAAALTGRFGRPFDAGVPGSTITANAGQVVASGNGNVNSQPQVTGTSAAGTSLTVRFATGSGVGPQTRNCGSFLNSYPCGPYSRLPADLTVAEGGPSGPLPAVATSAYLGQTGARPGDTVTINVNGASISATIKSAISGFPTISGAGGGLVVDQSGFQQALATAGVEPWPVTEWWLRAAGPPSLAGLPAGATLADRAATANALLADPLAAAPQLAMLAIAAAAVVLAAAGFLVSAATARDRARDVALLAALGATRGQLTRLLCLEQAVLAVPAAAAGLLLGSVLARLVVPAVTLTAAGAHPQPPVLVQVPLAVPAVLALAVAAAPVLIAVFGTGSRAGLAARTRLEAQT